MRLFRSEDSLCDESLRMQILQFFLFSLMENKPFMPTFEDLLLICEDEATRRDLLNVIVGLLDDRLLVEKEDRRLFLAQPNEAMIQAGFFPEDCLDLVPPGVRVFCLSEKAEQAIAEKGVDETARELAAKLAAELAAELN